MLSDGIAEQPVYIDTEYSGSEIMKNPGWRNVPTLAERLEKEVETLVRDEFPRILDGGAAERYNDVSLTACHYVRYRRAGCLPNRSRIEAIKRVADDRAKDRSTVYDHLYAAQEAENKSIERFEESLEIIYERFVRDGSVLFRELRESNRRLVRVLSALVPIEEAPGISPSDVDVQDVIADQPEGRARILTPDSEEHVVSETSPSYYGARIWGDRNKIEQAFGDLSKLRKGQAIEYVTTRSSEFSTERVVVETRDILTYDTAYSRVLRRVYKAVDEEMTVPKLQKSCLNISSRMTGQSHLSGTIRHPESDDLPYIRLRFTYDQTGRSDLTIFTEPGFGGTTDESPRLSGPIESITKPSIHVLIGKIAEYIGRGTQSR